MNWRFVLVLLQLIYLFHLGDHHAFATVAETQPAVPAPVASITKLSSEELVPMLERIEVLQLKHYEKCFRYRFSWSLLVRIDEGRDHLYIIDYKNKKIISDFLPANEDEQFQSLRVLELKGQDYPAILSIWTNGAHGEVLRIHLPQSPSTPLYEIKSSWPIDYKVLDDKVEIKTLSEGSVEKKSEWRPEKPDKLEKGASI
jgi:hypothetical protein